MQSSPARPQNNPGGGKKKQKNKKNTFVCKGGVTPA